MSEKRRRYFLKEKEAKTLLTEVSQKAGLSLEQIMKTNINLEIVETDFAQIFLIKNRPILARIGEHIFPTLIFIEALSLVPKVVVDMGAIPHVCNGADIMAPGIVHVRGDVKKGDFVFVVDEKYGKAIAVGKALCDMSEAAKPKQGVVIRNIHFVGDKLWNFIKETKNS
jgi:PUA domain protein